MTLFLNVATPLFVLALVAHAAARGDRGWQLLPYFAGAALLALPLAPLAGVVAGMFPPRYQLWVLYLRLLVVDHALPLLAAVAISLLLQRHANGRSPTGQPVGLLHLLVTLGGFFSMFVILEQFSYHADPSRYRLILLPLLRLATVTAVAYLLARCAGAGGGLRVAAALAVLALPFLTAALAYAEAIQRPVVAMAGSILLLATALVPVLLLPPLEVPDGRA